MNYFRRQSLRTKIIIAMTALIILNAAILGSLIGTKMKSTRRDIIENNKQLSSTVKTISSSFMKTEVSNRMLDVAKLNAESADSDLEQFKETVEMLAADAEYYYDHADSYGRFMVSPPNKDNQGVLSLHMTYSKDTNINDPAIRDEAGLLGNGQSSLLNAHAGNPSMAACYFATETGLFIEADYSAGAKCDEDGTPLNYEAKKRPWYIETKEAGETHFTSIVRESTGKRAGR